jgi:DNA/RNA-binding domain of Phe-tRNA-synthetase-like protein
MPESPVRETVVPPEVPADEHDGAMATQAELLEQLQGEVEELQAQLTAATATDKPAEIVKWRKAYDHANRQYSEAQDRAKEATDREAWTMRQLRRCGKAVGVDDPTKIAPAVEALARRIKVPA